MSYININIQANTAARSLDQVQEMLGRSLNRLSSGSKIVNPSDDSAGLAVSEKLNAQNLRVQAASTNVQNAMSYLQTVDSFMGGMAKILSRMGELSSFGHDVTKAPADIALYQLEFSALQEQLRATIGGSTAEIGGSTGVSAPAGSFNGTELFGSAIAPTVSIGHSVEQNMAIPTFDLRGGAMLSLINQDASGHFLTQATDASTLTTINNATQQIALLRATVGATESRLQLAASTLQVESENMISAISRIRDVDVAQESTQLAKYNILVQASTAMLAQANQTPQAVLKLLQ
ncbi:MAG: flagellin [Opitutae bacterium]